MKSKLYCKILAVGIICLFIGVGIHPAFAVEYKTSTSENENPITTSGDVYENHNCLLVGKTYETYRAGGALLGNKFLWIVYGKYDDRFGEGYYPAEGWIYTQGEHGKWSYNGKFHGMLDTIVDAFGCEYYIGIKGFIGIFLNSFYIGFADSVKIITTE